MRQIVLFLHTIVLLMLPVSLVAADHDLYNNSASLNLGYAIVSADPSLYAGKTLDLQINHNLSEGEESLNLDALQLTLTYTMLNDDERDHVFGIGGNVMWYAENFSDWTPYFKTGLGIQFFSGNETTETADHFFGTVGGGIEYQLRGDTSIIGELVDRRTFSSENTLKASVGIKYSFGQDN